MAAHLVCVASEGHRKYNTQVINIGVLFFRPLCELLSGGVVAAVVVAVVVVIDVTTRSIITIISYFLPNTKTKKEREREKKKKKTREKEPITQFFHLIKPPHNPPIPVYSSGSRTCVRCDGVANKAVQHSILQKEPQHQDARQGTQHHIHHQLHGQSCLIPGGGENKGMSTG